MAVLATLVAVPACGGDDGAAEEAVAPDAWVAVVCGEVARAAVDLEAALAVIDELPDEVAADAPLGDHADDLRGAFLALPAYVGRFRAVVEDTPPPATADGAAFRHELLADLDAATETFGDAAEAAGSATRRSACGEPAWLRMRAGWQVAGWRYFRRCFWAYSS